MKLKHIKTDIRNLDCCPHGEAGKIYLQYKKSPFYIDSFLIIKLLMCLFYEGGYSDAVSLACDNQNNSKKGRIPEIYFFLGMAYDIQNQRDNAVAAYKEILMFDCILSARYCQFGIVLCREFVEYLISHPYTIDCGKIFDFPIKINYKTPEYYAELLNSKVVSECQGLSGIIFALIVGRQYHSAITKYFCVAI